MRKDPVLQRNVGLLLNIRHITQNELADEVGISRETMHSIFNRNDFNPSLYTLTAIADYFDVSLDWLIGRSKDMYAHKRMLTYISNREIQSRMRNNKMEGSTK